MTGNDAGLHNDLGEDVTAEGRRLFQRITVVLVLQDVQRRDVSLANGNVDPGSSLSSDENLGKIWGLCIYVNLGSLHLGKFEVIVLKSIVGSLHLDKFK